MDDYVTYYSPSEAAQINKQAAQDYLDFHNASESQIIELLNSFMPKYRELKEEFYTLPAGKIKLAKKHINEKTNILYQLADVMTKEAAKYIAHSFYCNNIENLNTKAVSLERIFRNVNERITSLERKYNNGELNDVILDLNNENNKIQVKLDVNPDLVNITMNGRAFQADKKAFVWLCVFKSFPAKYTSREKAGRFCDYYLKKAEEIVKEAGIPLSLIKDLQANIKKLETESKTHLAKEDMALYMVKYNQFKAEFVKSAKNSIFAYANKAPDSKLKKEIKRSLLKAQKDEISKNSENKELVSPATLIKLLADIDAGLVNLGEGKGNSADANSNKGME